MIAEYFKRYNDADIIFDPVPSYSGIWEFDITGFAELSKVNDGINLFKQFLNKTYLEPLQQIFNTELVKNFKISMISLPNKNNVGRSLQYSKHSFFEDILMFLDQKIDRKGKTDEEVNKHLLDLAKLIDSDNDTRNLAFLNALKEKANKLNDLKSNQINSLYFESAMEDFEDSEEEMSFTEYIEKIYNDVLSLQRGMIRLEDFFDKRIDYKALYNAFEPDTFYLLFAKIIYDINIKSEKNSGSLNSSCNYLYYYNEVLKEVSKKEKHYNPDIFYKRSIFRKERVSRFEIEYYINRLFERHPEAIPTVLVEENVEKENYKDIGLMSKIANINKLVWKVMLEGQEIEKIESEDKLIKDINMRIGILENSGPIINPLQGLNALSGYYAFIYPNGNVIIEKFWENKNPTLTTVTYILTIEEFLEMSNAQMPLKEYIKANPIVNVKRIFHTSINNWQRNLFNEINGNYRKEDAINFINSLRTGDINE